MSDRDTNRVLAVVAGIAILTGPRRTRPLAGLLYGLVLSRAQGASRRRLEAELHGLFAQRKSVTQRLADEVTPALEALEQRTRVLESTTRVLSLSEREAIAEELWRNAMGNSGDRPRGRLAELERLLIGPRLDELERWLGAVGLRDSRRRLERLGPVRVPGSMDWTPDEAARLRKWERDQEASATLIRGAK